MQQPTLTNQPITSDQLGRKIKSARNIMRKDKGLNGELDRLPQLTWIMLLKFIDDAEVARENKHTRRNGELEPALIEAPYRWRDWVRGSRITGDELISFVGSEETARVDGTQGPGLFEYLGQINDNEPGSRRNTIANVFSSISNRMTNGHLLRDVVDKVDEIEFVSDDELHALSHVYESMLKEMRDAAGDSGEFYTPRAVVRFMVEAIDPQPGETVMDPACGTGGFLVESHEHLKKRKKQTRENDRASQDDSELVGWEAKALPYLLTNMNLLLHGVNRPHVHHGNSLRLATQGTDVQDRVEIILTNPPFGGEEERDVQEDFPENKRTSDTTLLFIQLLMNKLKQTDNSRGRAGVVVPDGTLFSTGVGAKIKERLVQEFNLHTIVRLPKGVFAPYTDIHTNILFFDTSGPTEEIWYYEQPLPLDSKGYTKTKPIRFEEFRDCLVWWNQRVENERAWQVPVSELYKTGYNLDLKNPRTARVNHRAHDELSTAYLDLRKSAKQLSGHLRDEVVPLIENSELSEALRENFSLLTGSKNGIHTLRDLILRFAFCGKLVLQDSTEGGSVRALLTDIENRKRYQDKHNRLARSNNLPPVESSEAPFSIPGSWCWVRLGDLGQIVGGGTPRTDNPMFFSEEDVPWLTPADLYGLDRKFIAKGKRDLSSLGLSKSSARLLPEGSVLFSSRAPIGYVAIAEVSLATNQGFKSCVPYVKDMNQYIYYFLKFAAQDIERRASGTTFKEISAKKLSLELVPLAPLGEQKGIVAKLDELLSLCIELERKVSAAEDTREEYIGSICNSLALK